MDEGYSPAVMDEAPNAEMVEQTPTEQTQGLGDQTSTPEQAQGTASAPADQPSALVASEPDISTLLANEEIVKKLLEAEPIKQVIHRERSDAGRKWKQQLDALQAQAQARQQEQQLQEMLAKDEFELGTDVKARVQQERLQAEIRNRELAALAVQLRSVADEWELPDEDRAKTDPRAYQTPKDYLNGLVEIAKQDWMKKNLPGLVKREVEARIAEAAAQQRKAQPSPVTLPPGGGALSDSEFMKEYAAGRTSDHARARKLLEM